MSTVDLNDAYDDVVRQIDDLQQKIAKKQHALDTYRKKAHNAKTALDGLQSELDVLNQRKENISLKATILKMQQEGASNADIRPKELKGK